MLGWLARHPRVNAVAQRLVRALERGHLRVDTAIAIALDAIVVLLHLRSERP